ncbi:MAG: DUF378 domain-containing protein, partial [Planctomycetota bacterium]
MLKLNTLTIISLVLLIIGALNWGFVGFFNFDLVAALFGEMSFLARLIYGIVGIAAIVMLVELGVVIEHY